LPVGDRSAVRLGPQPVKERVRPGCEAQCSVPAKALCAETQTSTSRSLGGRKGVDALLGTCGDQDQTKLAEDAQVPR
jgi:hypothetical protein